MHPPSTVAEYPCDCPPYRVLFVYQERKIKPRRATRVTKLTLLALSRFFPWRQALTIVQPATFLRWHRNAFRLFWRWKSRPRGRLPPTSAI